MLDNLDYMLESKHERVILHTDSSTGLRAVIALHSTVRGPALGGIRLWSYSNSEAAIHDALLLSEAMTKKAVVAGVPFGGGKAVILHDEIGKDPKIRAARFSAFGQLVESLKGLYIATEDIGTTPVDIAWVKRTSQYVVGVPVEEGGSGDPSPMTAFGIIQGIRALIEDVLGTSNLEGIRVAIQGLGNVGMNLAKLLLLEGAVVIGSDIRPEVAQEANRRLGIEIVEPCSIYDVPCDIFAPCALGGVINDRTIERLTCKIIAGSANNQLDDERHGEELHDLGITYAVDYVINAGGLINVAQEIDGYDAMKAREKTGRIYSTIKQILATSHAEGISTQRAAHRLVQNILKGAD